MGTIVAIAISLVALAVSALTAWLTFFHRGEIRMTVPSIIAFAYDGRGEPGKRDPKVMVKTLLFTTGSRGHAIETLFLRLRHHRTEYIFPVWGVDTEKLERGGGLFVGTSGVTAWHHFVAAETARNFEFTSGSYTLEILARVDGLDNSKLLWTARLSLPDDSTPRRHDGSEQVWFDRDPESTNFEPGLQTRGARGRPE